MSSPPLDRRSLLRLAAVSVVAAGCQRNGQDPSGPPEADAPTRGRSARPSPARSLAPVPRYALLAGEALPNLKQAAADFAQALTTRPSGRQPVDVVAGTAALVATTFDAASALRTAGPLYEERITTGEVVYAQLSGLVPLGAGATRAGVMVVVRQRLLSPQGREAAVVRVLDVRLQVQQGNWRVTELVVIGGEPVDRPPDLPPQALAVLDNPRIELPDTCRWDVHAGRVATDLLSVLGAAAAVQPVAVTVLRTGHPQNVFGTDRISNHTQGRAVDLWRVGGQPVVSTGAVQGPARAVLAAAAADARTRQTGSPPGSDLDGPGRRSFTDLVHQDHLHLAVGASVSG